MNFKELCRALTAIYLISLFILSLRMPIQIPNKICSMSFGSYSRLIQDNLSHIRPSVIIAAFFISILSSCVFCDRVGNRSCHSLFGKSIENIVAISSADAFLTTFSVDINCP